MIPYDIKRKCVDLANQGKPYKEIYNEYIKPRSEMSLRSFNRRMAEWKEKMVDDAVWEEDKDDVRLDDGSTNIDSLDAQEYSSEPFMRTMIDLRRKEI